MDWDGRVVLVTGGSRGIGLATAKRFCDGGASVVIAGRSEEALAAAAVSLGHEERVAAVAADVGTVAGCYAAVDGAVTTFGRLDVLFTNAGSYESAPLGEVTEDMWDRTVDTHLKGTFFCVQAAAGALRTARGCVVTMASDAGLLGCRGGWAAYCAAMGGVVNLTRQLAADLAPEVRVNAVAPGPVMWPEDGVDKALQEKITQRTALKRPGSAQDVARACLFFATEAPYVTGQILAVDGGRSIGW